VDRRCRASRRSTPVDRSPVPCAALGLTRAPRSDGHSGAAPTCDALLAISRSRDWEWPRNMRGRKCRGGLSPCRSTSTNHCLSRRARILAQLSPAPKGAHISAALIDSQCLEGPVVVLVSSVSDTTHHRPELAQCSTSKIPVASCQGHARARADEGDRSARIAAVASLNSRA